jgi:Xaa-Pro aminopeptidase
MTEFTSTFINDGLSFDEAVNRYHTRQQAFLNRCTDICIINGVSTPLDQHNFWLLSDYPLYQNPTTLFLTGLNQLNVAIIFNPFNSTISLAIPQKDDKKVFWEGHFLGYDSERIDTIKRLFKFDEIIHFNDIFTYLETQLSEANSNRLSAFWYEDSISQKPLEDSHFLFKLKLETSFKSIKKDIEILNCHDLLKDRLCLDQIDQNNAKHANFLAKNVFTACCKSLKSAKSETEIAGILKGEIYKQCPLGQSFPAIVATGKNASILHYQKNDSPLEKNGLLLLDFGCRYHNVVSDISRTLPVNGRFNPLQKILYLIVLKAQKHVESKVKAGICIDELNQECWKLIETELELNLLNRNGKMTRAYETQPHNVSHLIAHSVHDGDPFRLYRSNALKEGMIISNEPGLYGYFELEINGIVYKEHCGIRIEDNLLVQQNGCLNLSTSIPKEIAEIELLLV